MIFSRAVIRMLFSLAIASAMLGASRVAHAQTATLLLECNVQRAEVLLDGSAIGQTNSDGQFYSEVPAGEHRLIVRRRGYESVNRVVQLREGLTTPVPCNLQQERVSADILVDANTSGAVVFLDGRRVGETRYDGKLRISTTPGVHELRVQRPGFETETKTVEAPRGGLTHVVGVDLERERSLWNQFTQRWNMFVGNSSTNWSLIVSSALLGGILVVSIAIALLLRQDPFGGGTATSQFDRYALLKQLGRGGMATVYLARDTAGRQEVALKVMESGLLHDRDLVWKFLKEGEALQRIHEEDPEVPVVRAFRFGREHDLSEGRPFIALEYIPGETLSALIQQNGAFPVPTTLRVVEQICRGLKAAHANRIWHRDVTPDNVIASGRFPELDVTLIDFGVAKHEYTARKTLDGSITGKPPYMSPEQCRGESVTDKSDVYSLGILAYVLLTKKPPFSHRNPLQVMKMHQRQDPPPLPDTVPQAVQSLVSQMLSKQPASRPSVDSISKTIRTLEVTA